MNSQLFRACLLIILLVLLSIAPPPIAAAQDPDIVGKWQGADSAGDVASLVFDKEGYVIMTRGKEVLGVRKKGAPSVKYEFVFSKTPVWLDFIFCDHKGKEQARVRSIVKFLGAGKMQWRISDNMVERPTEFDENDKENTIILEKVL